MDLNPYKVAIARGVGLVARFGDVVMYVADETAAAAPLLAAADAVAAIEEPGTALAKKLAAVAFGPHSAEIPPFGVIAPNSDGLLLILRGPVEADIQTDENARRVSGEHALTWVEDSVSGLLQRLTIAPVGKNGVRGCPETDLRAGVAPGGGLIIGPRRAASDRRSRYESPSAAPASASQPLPAGADPTQRIEPGRFDSRRPGRPRAETAMASPAIGVLASDDEAVYPLDRPYVIGRNPLNDKAVRESMASPISLPGDPQISRVHAYVWVTGGRVLVRDAGTPAGTFIAAPGDREWTMIGTTEAELKVGWCIRIGKRILAYQKAGGAQ